MGKNRCGICRQLGHTARNCPKRPDATLTIRVPLDDANLLYYDRLAPLWRASTWDDNPLKSALLSAYLQGALDGRQIHGRV